MKVNPLIMDLFRGEWLLDVQFIAGAAPLISNLLKGNPLNLPEITNAAGIMHVVDGNGHKLKADSDGRVSIPKDSIAVVNMIGAVVKRGDLCTYGADEIVEALQKADDNPNIKATIFVIDGPGGAVSAIGPFLDFAANKTKPVIGLADACMSLHYWTAVSVCDHLMADNDVSARFGSVGVVSSFMDATAVWEAQGYKFHEIYAVESEDKNSSFREALKGEYDQIRAEHLSPIAQKFQAAVRKGRPGLKEEKGVLSGKTFDADKAFGLGMIDGVGGFKNAMQMAHVMAELNPSINNY